MRPEDSPLRVRRSIHVHAAPAVVWEAFTSLERMATWWGRLAAATPQGGQPSGQWLDAFEPRTGGRIVMAVMMDGQRAAFGGEIRVFDAGRELTFDNDWIPNRGWSRPTAITLRLAPVLGGTLVELFHYGFERTGGDASAEHAGYERGWGMLQLEALRAVSEARRA